MTDFIITDVLESLYNAVAGIASKTYLDRPQSVDAKLNDFVVVSLPVTFYRKTLGSGYGLYNSYCRIEIYVRDNSFGGRNIARIRELQVAVLDKFPISDGSILACKPRVLDAQSDGEGFHAIVIQATISTQ